MQLWVCGRRGREEILGLNLLPGQGEGTKGSSRSTKQGTKQRDLTPKPQLRMQNAFFQTVLGEVDSLCELTHRE